MGRQNVIPDEIQNILMGQTVLFKVQLRNETDFNKDRPYNISKICNDPNIVKTYSICFESCTNDKNGDLKFYEECNALPKITELGSTDGIGKVIVFY